MPIELYTSLVLDQLKKAGFIVDNIASMSLLNLGHFSTNQ